MSNEFLDYVEDIVLIFSFISVLGQKWVLTFTPQV
jgi:hypothetical protein